MIGHGGPRTSPGKPASTTATRWPWRSALLALLLLVPHGLAAADETMRLRIAWGGGSERLWAGTVALSGQGTLAEPRPLGIEADEPGSMWLEQGQLIIRQRSARAYDGVDLLVSAPLDAKLLVQLSAGDDPNQPVRLQIPLSDLSEEAYDQELDAWGNRLLVRRTPGDGLRIRLERDSLVFSPDDELLRCVLEPRLLPVPAGSKVRIDARLVAAGDERALWSEEADVWAGQPEDVPLNVALPTEEGVYELIITAKYHAGWSQAVLKPLRPFDWNKTVAQRKVQLLVLGPPRQTPPGGARRELEAVVEIDPANPGWRERLAKLPHLPKIPRLWNGPLSSGNVKVGRHPLGQVVQLAPSAESDDVSWEAYTLPINEPGRPHILEVDYPSDVSQTMGISVLEPNAAGALMPIGLDSGVDVRVEAPGEESAPRWARHRLIFWPRTTTPMVLITNRRDRFPAVFGKIRVLAGWEHLPAALGAEPRQQPQRLLAAYLHRPLFPENFSATESLDPQIRRGVDDWRTFYEGGTRLVEYLEHVGYNGLMISVVADGSSIYPSEILQPTPRYDTGVFFTSAQDPVRKDVLEMLLRLFDRRRLQLIPAIEFAAPLPELEKISRAGGPEAEGLRWVGPNGKTWCQTYPARRGLAPYYNVLHPRVQEEMLRVVRELIDRYAHHLSFGGLAIQLSAQGYAQLPGPHWGMDDATIARFQRDTNLAVPGEGPSRFAQRDAFLSGRNRATWLQWRAAELSRFHHRVHAELARNRPGSRLYLAGAGALTGSDPDNALRPALPQRIKVAEALMRVGIDERHYRDNKELVLLRPEQIVSTGRLGGRAVSLIVRQMPDVDDYFQSLPTPGSLFFHPPQEVRVESFDRKSYFQPSYTQLVAQLAPSGRQNRRRFVHSLATLDPQVMIDGGWLLPLGQEESIRDLLAAYRRLPPVRFRPAGDPRGAHSSQPVTFRYATHGGATYLYVVNDAPFRTTARVGVQTPEGCRLEELTGLRPVSALKRDAEGTYWTVRLRPYDLVAVRLSEPGAKVFQPQAWMSPAVETALKQRIGGLAARAAWLNSPPSPLKVLVNPGFERPPVEENPLPGWTTTRQSGVSIAPDKTQRRGGQQSVRMASSRPVACLVSQPFELPATGRLSMRVWLRVPDAAVQPPLRLALEGKLYGQPYYRFAPVGLALRDAPNTPAIGSDWNQPPFVFRVEDLPLQGLSQLRVRFDLMGPGEVWIDDVELFDLDFSPVFTGNRNELTELNKLILAANFTLEDRQVGDCMRLLDGYWPRFLEEHVPLPPTALPVARRPERTAGKPPPPPPQQTGFTDRLKSLLPKSIWF